MEPDTKIWLPKCSIHVASPPPPVRLPHTKAIRRFHRPRAGVNGPLGRYIIRLTGKDIPEFLTDAQNSEAENERPQNTKTIKLKGNLAPLMPLTNHYVTLRRRSKGRVRQVNIEFQGPEDTDGAEGTDTDHIPPLTTTLTFSDYLCKWCLTYVGQRRQFCSADCAAQFKLCQKRRDQKQVCNLNVCSSDTCKTLHSSFRIRPQLTLK